MKYILYKYRGNTKGNSSLVYLSGIHNSEPQFSRHSSDARRYTLVRAVYLSLYYDLTWISERYIH